MPKFDRRKNFQIHRRELYFELCNRYHGRDDEHVGNNEHREYKYSEHDERDEALLKSSIQYIVRCTVVV